MPHSTVFYMTALYVYHASDMNVDFPALSFAARCADTGYVPNRIVLALPRIRFSLNASLRIRSLPPGSHRVKCTEDDSQDFFSSPPYTVSSFCAPRLRTATRVCDIMFK